MASRTVVGLSDSQNRSTDVGSATTTIKLIGYARVSTLVQYEDRQLADLRTPGVRAANLEA